MRQTMRLFAYAPSIKFVGGPHLAHVKPATIHPCAPQGLAPSKGTTTSSFTPQMQFQSRNNLSKRFRYSVIDDIEISDVMTGGAEVFIK
ncbi:hypothetical protein DAMA08_030720 [Martiniozyma asiatica (nom. inval.)]|nr:hypothetical protein DAMA08_030720 [Martiniozyma asiatica]